MLPEFETTRWSIVLTAGEADTSLARDALAHLCEAYWYPLYAFVRRRGCGAEEAEDLIQGYFAVFLEKDYARGVRPEAGRFRAFLLASLKHFLANEWDRERAQKRGGDLHIVSLDAVDAERRYRLEPVDTVTPEQVFEQRWALTVVERTMTRLSEESRSSGGTRRFERLRGFLVGGSTTISYRQIAAELEMSEGAVKVAVHRLRKRFGELLRIEIAQTLVSSADVDGEIRRLITALGR